jgi:hypothetical protein
MNEIKKGCAQVVIRVLAASTLYTMASPHAAEAAVLTLTSGSGTFNYSGQLDTFTVPTTGVYTFNAFGAQGGGGGAKGGQLKASFNLSANTILSILIGGQGGSGTSGSNGGISPGGGGGGGGTFVATILNGTPTLLLSATGGVGSRNNNSYGAGSGLRSNFGGGNGGGYLGGGGIDGNRGGDNGIGSAVGGSSGNADGTNGGNGGDGGFGGGNGGGGGDSGRGGIGGFSGRGGIGLGTLNGNILLVRGSGNGFSGGVSNISNNTYSGAGNGDGSFVGISAPSIYSQTALSVSFNNGVQSGNGSLSITFTDPSTPVPEPFTIVGTLIGSGAAYRMRKRLKAVNELVTRG